jgi:superfamily II DNA helicase RecQ
MLWERMFRYKFFVVPAEGDDVQERELNGFLSSHSILDVKQEYHAGSGISGSWCFCIRWKDGPTSVAGAPRKSRTDYKEILGEGEFTLYLQLRELRKRVANREQVPAYTVFTNDQLAEMAKARPTSANGLKKIEGVGDSRFAKYGEEFLALLCSSPADVQDGAEGVTQ